MRISHDMSRRASRKLFHGLFQKAVEERMMTIRVVLGFALLATVLVAPAVGQMTAQDWVDKSNAFLNQSNYEGAIQAYDTAIELDPNDVEAWNNKGNVLAVQGKYDDAFQAFDRAIKLKPDLAMAWYNKGNAFGQQGKCDDAIKCYDKAIELNPNYIEAWS